jgi:hypothetical protein
MVPGQSIGLASLGETRRALTTELVREGYTGERSSLPSETIFTSESLGLFVVGFDNGSAVFIQKYGDPAVKIDGISVQSTLRTARRALLNWRSIRCPKDAYTFLVAPGGHTYFELPLGLDTANHDSANGVVVAAEPRLTCN